MTKKERSQFKKDAKELNRKFQGACCFDMSAFAEATTPEKLEELAEAHIKWFEDHANDANRSMTRLLTEFKKKYKLSYWKESPDEKK